MAPELTRTFLWVRKSMGIWERNRHLSRMRKVSRKSKSMCLNLSHETSTTMMRLWLWWILMRCIQVSLVFWNVQRKSYVDCIIVTLHCQERGRFVLCASSMQILLFVPFTFSEQPRPDDDDDLARARRHSHNRRRYTRGEMQASSRPDILIPIPIPIRENIQYPKYIFDGIPLSMIY